MGPPLQSIGLSEKTFGKRFKLRIRGLIRAGRHLDPAQLVSRLRLFLTGWRGYFGFCETPPVLRRLDKWLRRRLRMVFWRPRRQAAPTVRGGSAAARP
ncbi:MAG: hypothetical protein M1438_17935 [Deltaproteobacteria bacterium]|nr:hypothetical protein [Deltaproteobacteria bacterium]